MAGTTRLVLDFLHARKVSLMNLRFKSAQFPRYPNFATRKWVALQLLLPQAQYVRKSAELAKAILTTINSAIKKSHTRWLLLMAGTTRLELATSCVTGMRSNQLSYAPIFNCHLVLTAPLVNLLVSCSHEPTPLTSLRRATPSLPYRSPRGNWATLPYLIVIYNQSFGYSTNIICWKKICNTFLIKKQKIFLQVFNNYASR